MLRTFGFLALLLAVATATWSASPPPVARDDLACGERDSAIRGNVLANDGPPGEATRRPERAGWRAGERAAARIETVMAPAHGELVGAGTIYGGVTPWGDFEYRPAAGFVGVDVFAYRSRSGARVSEVATVRLVVGAVQVSTPAGEPGANLSLFAPSFEEGTGLLLADRADIEGQRFSCHTPTGRGFTADGLVEIWVEDVGAISLFDVRALRLASLDQALEIATERTSQRFRILPAGGGAFHVVEGDSGLAWTAAGPSAGGAVVGRFLEPESEAGQVWFFVGPGQAPPPFAFDDEYRVESSDGGAWSGITGNVLGNDVASGFEAVARLASPPEHGELVGVGASIYGGVAPWGAFEYRPTPGFVGVDRFTYYALGATGMGADLGAPSRVATVRIRVGDQVADVR